MEAVIAVAIVAAYLAGSAVQRRRWARQRATVLKVVEEACEARRQSHHAFEVQMDVIRRQRQLIDSFAEATETIWVRDDAAAWQQLRTAQHRARTELL